MKHAAAPIARTHFGNGEFSIGLPPWTSWTKTVPVDFAIYRIIDDRTGSEILRMYVGNNPDFAAKHAAHSTINGLKAMQIRRCAKDKCMRDVLIALPRSSPDLYVEMWYSGLATKHAAASDRVIQSIRYGFEARSQNH